MSPRGSGQGWQRVGFYSRQGRRDYMGHEEGLALHYGGYQGEFMFVKICC